MQIPPEINGAGSYHSRAGDRRAQKQAQCAQTTSGMCTTRQASQFLKLLMLLRIYFLDFGIPLLKTAATWGGMCTIAGDSVTFGFNGTLDLASGLFPPFDHDT